MKRPGGVLVRDHVHQLVDHCFEKRMPGVAPSVCITGEAFTATTFSTGVTTTLQLSVGPTRIALIESIGLPASGLASTWCIFLKLDLRPPRKPATRAGRFAGKVVDKSFVSPAPPPLRGTWRAAAGVPAVHENGLIERSICATA